MGSQQHCRTRPGQGVTCPQLASPNSPRTSSSGSPWVSGKYKYSHSPSTAVANALRMNVPGVPTAPTMLKKEADTAKLAAQLALVVIEAAAPRQEVGKISLHTVQGTEPRPGAKTRR